MAAGGKSNHFDCIKEVKVSATFLLPRPVIAVAMLHFYDATVFVLRQ